jgi:hypothetical protein
MIYYTIRVFLISSIRYSQTTVEQSEDRVPVDFAEGQARNYECGTAGSCRI